MINYPIINIKNLPKAVTDRHTKKDLETIINERNTTDSYLRLDCFGRIYAEQRNKYRKQ